MAHYTETPLSGDVFSFSTGGRMVRSRYAAAAVFWVLLASAACALAFFSESRIAAWCGVLTGIASVFGFAAASVRRLHDMDCSGFWAAAVLLFFPVGLVPLLMTESRAGENRWGENPKGLLKISDPRLLEKLGRESQSGSVMDEIAGGCGEQLKKED